MSTNYKINNMNFEDLFIRRDLFNQGGLWSWGNNADGELGDNTTVRKSSPVQTLGGGTNWKQVSSGYSHTTAIKTDGTLWTWGYNNSGQLGTNTLTQRSNPGQTVSGGTNWKLVVCGGYHTAAIKTDGTLWVWGRNTLGQLGTNNITGRSSPVQTISSGANWKQASCGYYYTAAIKTDGTLWTWGNNSYGQLGDNTATDKSSPVQTVSGGTNWKVVDLGDNQSASQVSAIKTDGTLWLWGNNNYGNLGDNTTIKKSSPVQTVSGGTNWKSVSNGFGHTAAIKTDGTLWLWGYNISGELGDGTTTNKSSPVQTVSGGTNWKLVNSGRTLTGAIKTDGTLWLWGSNTYGDLGDNTTIKKSSPVQTVSGGTNWRQVSGGDGYTVALNDTWGTIT